MEMSDIGYYIINQSAWKKNPHQNRLNAKRKEQKDNMQQQNLCTNNLNNTPLHDFFTQPKNDSFFILFHCLPFKMLHLICPGGNGFAMPDILEMLFGISAGKDFDPQSSSDSRESNRISTTITSNGKKNVTLPSSLLISFLFSSRLKPQSDSLARLLNRKSNWLSVLEGVGLMGGKESVDVVDVLRGTTGLKRNGIENLLSSSQVRHSLTDI